MSKPREQFKRITLFPSEMVWIFAPILTLMFFGGMLPILLTQYSKASSFLSFLPIVVFTIAGLLLLLAITFRITIQEYQLEFRVAGIIIKRSTYLEITEIFETISGFGTTVAFRKGTDPFLIRSITVIMPYYFQSYKILRVAVLQTMHANPNVKVSSEILKIFKINLGDDMVNQ